MKENIEVPLNIYVTVDGIVVSKELLEEILHELTSIDGLKAFDCKADGTWEGAHYVQVDKEDLIDLDYHILMGKIKLALDGG